ERPGGQPPDRGEQDPADAAGVRGPPAARRPCVPRARTPGGGPDHRQRPVAPGRADRRGSGGEPAPGVLPTAELQPDPKPGRAVLEEAAAAGDPQPAVRHPGRPQAIRPQQPELLPDGPGEGPVPHPRLLRGTAEPDTITGLMNQRPVVPGSQTPATVTCR